MIPFDNLKRTGGVLVLAFAPSACDVNAELPVFTASGQTAAMNVFIVGWPEPGPSAIVDGMEPYN